MITLENWGLRRSTQLRRMARSAQELAERGIRIVTEFDDELRLQDIKDEANEWPCRWGLM